MRFEGKLDKWNDDRGFGFITPVRGGEPVFVHISAFPRDGHRPQPGDLLTFEVEPAGDGKKRAINVQRAASTLPRAQRRPTADGVPRHGPRASGGRRSIAGAAITIGLVAAGGGLAYTQLGGLFSRAGTAAPAATQAPDVSQGSSGTFRCDGRTHCSQMTSCEEAKFFLKNCPNTQMDGDRDGIPCETQWCSSLFGR